MNYKNPYKAKPRQLEDSMCKAFVQELDWKIKTEKLLNGLFYYHIPNGGSRNILEAKKLKLMGTRRGVSDYFIMKASGKYHGLYLEFKVKTKDYKNYLSQEQKAFFETAEIEGYKAVMVTSAEEAIAEIYKYIRDN